MESERKYSKSDIMNRIALYREKISKLEDILLTLRELDTLMSEDINEDANINYYKVNAEHLTAPFKRNDSNILMDILKSSNEPLLTWEIVELYANRTNSEVDDIRAFVDGTLNRLKKAGIIESFKKDKTRGSYYKIKASGNNSDAFK